MFQRGSGLSGVEYSACVLPLYTEMGDTYERSSFRGISLLSVVGKVYGRCSLRKFGW